MMDKEEQKDEEVDNNFFSTDMNSGDQEEGMEAEGIFFGQREKDPQIEEEYEADYHSTTVYHTGENNGKHMNEYEFLEKLGKGSFGKVKKVSRKFLDTDGVSIVSSFYAAKQQYVKQIFNKNQLERERFFIYTKDGETEMTNRLANLYEEIQIYKHLNHPNICKLYQKINSKVIDDDTDEKMYMIMEYCDLGQLMNWDEDRQEYDPNLKLDEFITSSYKLEVPIMMKLFKGNNKAEQRELQAKVIFKQVAEGIKYLHKKRIVNRDIKIDNILCSSTGELYQHVKLADFSTAKQLDQTSQKLRDCSGTSGFRCPQQQFNLDNGYDGMSCDIWSLGITLITYINFKIPFWRESALQTDIAAKNEPIKYEDHNSQELRNLIELMCKKEESDRIHIDEVIAHPFFDWTRDSHEEVK